MRTIGRIKPTVALLLSVCVMALSLGGCGRIFDGSLVKNSETYLLNMERMTGADTHTMDLTEGDRLKVSFVTEEGSLILIITAPDGTVPYQGNGSAAEEFTLNLSRSGPYTLHTEGNRWKGYLRVNVEE